MGTCIPRLHWCPQLPAPLAAYLDRMLPRRPAYVDEVHPSDTPNREFDVQKHWWGMRIVELGLKALYMDSDNVVLKDPFQPFALPFDVQVLQCAFIGMSACLLAPRTWGISFVADVTAGQICKHDCSVKLEAVILSHAGLV
jgi:hypothetical protein